MVTAYTRDSYGRITKETNSDSTYKTYAYGTPDTLTSVTNELGYTTSIAWDALDRQTSVTDPLSNVTSSKVYNAAGLVSARPMHSAIRPDYEYDSRNRLIEVDYARSRRQRFFDPH